MAKKAVFRGSLDFLGLPDLLQFLGTNGSTGVLRLTNPFSNETGSVFLKKGKPVNASNGSLDGLEALYSLFGWTTGEFKFTREKVRGKESIHKSQMEIILDGLRMLDEGVIKKIAPDSLKKGKSGPLDSGFKLPFITKSIPNYFLVVGEDQFQDGATIIEEGVFGNWIYIVLDGTAEMSKKTERGPVKILNAGPGAFVGNISSAMKQGFWYNNRPLTGYAVAELLEFPNGETMDLIDAESYTDECLSRYSTPDEELMTEMTLYDQDSGRSPITGY